MSRKTRSENSTDDIQKSEEEHKKKSGEEVKPREEKKKEEKIKPKTEHIRKAKVTSKYSNILGDGVGEIEESLTPKAKAALDLMAKYASIASPNVMLSDESKVLAPCVLLRLLVTLDSLNEKEPEQVEKLKLILNDNINKDGKIGVFNEIYVNRDCFKYDTMTNEDKNRLNDLIKKYLKK